MFSDNAINNTILLLLFPVAIMGFISKWRYKQAEKEEAKQNQAVA